MALKKQVITIPFTKGMNEKTSDFYLEPGELEDLNNGVFNNLGEITKRNGYDKETFLVTDAGRLEASFPFRSSLYLAYSESLLYRMSNVTHGQKFGSLNNVGYYSPFSTEVISGSSGDSLHHEEGVSIAQTGDFVCVAYLKVDYDYTNNVKHYSHVVNLIEKEGGTLIASAEGRTASTSAGQVYDGQIKVVSSTGTSQGYFFIYYEYRNGSAYELRRDRLKITASAITMPTLAGNGVVVAGSTGDYNQTLAQQWFDVIENGSQPVVCYYRLNSGANTVRYFCDVHSEIDGGTFSSPAHATDFTDGLGGTAPATRLAVGKSSVGAARFYISWRTGTTIQTRIVSENPGTSSAVATKTNSATYFQPHGFVDHVPTYSTSTNAVALMFEDGGSANATTQKIYNITDPTGTPAISGELSLGRGRSSVQGFQFQNGTDNVKTTVFGGSNAYNSDTELSTVSFHLDTNNAGETIVGRSLAQSYRPGYMPFGPCRVVGSGDTWYTAVPMTTNIGSFPTSASAVESVPNSVVKIIKITGDMPNYGVRKAAVGENVFFTFGNAIYHDSGGNVVNIAGLPKPEITSVATSGTSGSMTTSKTYKYKIVFEREDINGNLYRSEPSDPVSVAMSSNTSTVITYEQAGMIVKESDYSVAIYRTQADGNLYNRVATVTGQSDYSGGTSTFADTYADSVVAVGEALYTDTNELADVIVPPCFYVEEHRNRVFAITEENRIIFSKEYKRGFGVSFSDSFFIPLDGSLDDKPTALGSAGGDLYIFREQSIYVISGDGPSRTGSGSYFTPRLVSNTIGALKGSPTIFTDSGLFFQTVKGIYRIGKSGIEYVGAGIEKTMGTDVLREIIEDQKTQTIRFLTSDKVFALNTTYNQWSHWEYNQASDTSFSGMCSIDNVVYMTTNDNELWTEGEHSMQEDSAYLPLSLKTGWIHLNGIQGFARAYRFSLLGRRLGNDEFTLTIYVYADYQDAAPVDVYKISFDSNTQNEQMFQLRGHLTKQKCQALKFAIFDSAHADGSLVGSGTTKLGFTLSSLAIETAGKTGIYRLAESSADFDQARPNPNATSYEQTTYNLTRSIGDSSSGLTRDL